MSLRQKKGPDAGWGAGEDLDIGEPDQGPDRPRGGARAPERAADPARARSGACRLRHCRHLSIRSEMLESVDSLFCCALEVTGPAVHSKLFA